MNKFATGTQTPSKRKKKLKINVAFWNDMIDLEPHNWMITTYYICGLPKFKFFKKCKNTRTKGKLKTHASS